MTTPRIVSMGLAAVLAAGWGASARAGLDDDVERIISRHLETILPAGAAGGAAIAVRIDGQTVFLNYGFADHASKRPTTSDSLFPLASLRKVFETTLLAQAVRQAKLGLDDPIDRHVVELQQGGDIRRVTLGQLATHTSGLLLPQDHPPWPDWGYTLPEFIAALNAWKADKDHQPGQQHIYTHAGFVLLQLALERGLGAPIDALIEERITGPLRMTSTLLPRGEGISVGELTSEQRLRAVQGYAPDGQPQGTPGEQNSYYKFPGTAKMYSSARDMVALLAAHLGEMPVEPSLREGMALAQQGVRLLSTGSLQALAWEIHHRNPTIVDKYGGLWNAAAYVGMVPEHKVGIVILTNRGSVPLHEIGPRILLDLARRTR